MILLLVLAAGCGSPDPVADTGPFRTKNVLIVVLDDVGVDKVEPYCPEIRPDRSCDRLSRPDPTRQVPPTPQLSQLALQGLRFTNAYADPICSPTRASLLTGRHTLDHGVRAALQREELHTPETGLDPAWTTVADLIPPEGQAAFFGKWHLSSYDGWGYDGAPDAVVGSWDGWLDLCRNEADPAACRGLPGRIVDAYGFDRFAGRWSNGAYKNWIGMVADGRHRYQERRSVDWGPAEHPTTRITLDAMAFVAEAKPGWLAIVAYQSAHAPFHVPPDPATLPGVLHDPDTVAYSTTPGAFDGTLGQNPGQRKYNAMVQSLDHHVGALIRSTDPATTTVFVLGDNGTPSPVVDAAFTGGRVQGKGSPYEGGIAIPFLARSPDLDPQRIGGDEDALVHVSDLFATVHRLVGSTAPLPPQTFDLMPYLAGETPTAERRWVFTEIRRTRGPPFTGADNPPFLDCTLALIQDGRKLAVTGSDAGQRIELYDLSGGGAPLAYETPAFPYDPVRVPMGDRCSGGDLSAEDAAHYRTLRATLATEFSNSCWWLEHETSCCDGVDSDHDGATDADDPDCACDPDRHRAPADCPG